MSTRAASILFAAAALIGCARKPAIEMLPRTLEGGWRLQQSSAAPAEPLPEDVRSRAPASAATAVYSGPAQVRVTLCRMRGEASAMAVFQSWRPRDGVQPFYRGVWFGFAEGANPQTLLGFARALEKTLR
jgi:hypothetical protein